MLNLLRDERPDQVINKVVSIKEHKLKKYGVQYLVTVDMETMFFETKILHTIVDLPYPLQPYLDLQKTISNENSQH